MEQQLKSQWKKTIVVQLYKKRNVNKGTIDPKIDAFAEVTAETTTLTIQLQAVIKQFLSVTKL